MRWFLILIAVPVLSATASGDLYYDSIQWRSEDYYLIGSGTSLGTYNGFLTKDAVMPVSADSGEPGLYLAAGNLASVQDFGEVWNIHAEYSGSGQGQQTLGDWFIFEYTFRGHLTFYDSAGEAINPPRAMNHVSDAGGPYKIAPGETIVLDGSGSFSESLYVCFYAWLTEDNNLLTFSDEPLSSLTYDTLVNDLGLAPGVHELRLAFGEWDFGEGWANYWVNDTTTLEIVPEPATLVLFALGGFFIRRKRFVS